MNYSRVLQRFARQQYSDAGYGVCVVCMRGEITVLYDDAMQVL